MQPVIKLDGVQKIFYTDEVETHVLAGINLQVEGEGTFPSQVHPAAASPRCCRLAIRMARIAAKESKIFLPSSTAM